MRRIVDSIFGWLCMCEEIYVYCMMSVVYVCEVSFAWSPQSLLVQTSSSVIGGYMAVASPHKATCNNRGGSLCLHEGWWLMKWIAVFGQIFTNQFGPKLTTAALSCVTTFVRVGIHKREQVLRVTQTESMFKKKESRKRYIDLKRQTDAEKAVREILCVF